MKAILTCVNYSDYLAVTLPRNLRHFTDIFVVTTRRDSETWNLVNWMPHPVSVHTTNVFYENGAKFNKGAAIEEGFDVLGREGWICVLDADTLLPDAPGLFDDFQPGNLYSPHRRCLERLDDFSDDLDWATLPYGWEHPSCPRQAKVPNNEYAGYCQIFHAGDPVLVRRPWYPTDLPTAQGCDTAFYKRWGHPGLRRPPWEVLHLGPLGKYWTGRGRDE